MNRVSERPFLWLLLALLPLSNTALADPDSSADQQYLVKTWGADEGLPLTTVTDVAQTPEGFLWVGTLLHGLQRFDGVRFVGYGPINVPELRSMGIRRLMVDNSGLLWISTYGNVLVTWDQSGFKLAQTHAEADRPDRLLWSAPGRVVFVNADGRLLCGQKNRGGWDWQLTRIGGTTSRTLFVADANGRVWYRRSGTELGLWKDGVAKTFAPAGLEGQQIKTMAMDEQGRLWAGTEVALARWQGERFETMNPTNGEAQLNVKRIIPTGNNNSLWVEANGRMRRYCGQQWVAESEGWKRELSGISRLQFAYGDPKGGLWAASGLANSLGLFHVQADGNFIRLTTRDGLPSNAIQKVCRDAEGNIWAVYGRGGLVQVRPRLFQSIGERQGLKDALVTSVSEDPQGALWIGAYGGGVARYQSGQCTNYVPLKDYPRIPTVAADARSRVWIGISGGGLMVYEEDHFRVVADAKHFQGDIRLLLPTRDGRLWVATLEAVYVVANGNVTEMHRAQAPGEHVAALVEAADGTVFAGTHGGYLLRWNGMRCERITPLGDEKLGRFLALAPAQGGGLWIGSLWGGLLHWRDGQFRRYTTKDGLPSDSIAQILTDAQGNLWLGTGIGIARLDEAAVARFDRGEIRMLPYSIYGKNDGLLTVGSAIEFQPNCWRGRDGTLWFAMANSVAGVHPQQVRINALPPTVVIEEVRVNDKPVWPSQTASVLYSTALAAKQPAAAKDVLRVGLGRSDLDFRYTGLSLGSPAKVRFKFKLEGFDADWAEPDDERKAVYRQVPPGNYKFQVTACNSDGVWSEEPVEIDIRVEPHYYQTAWFRGGTILMAMVGLTFWVWTFARRRLRLRLERLESQQEIERERVRIAQDLHDDLGASLTEIGLVSSLAQRPGQPSGRVQNELLHISTKVREMVTSLDEIVWSLNPKHESLVALTQYFSEYAQQFLQPTSLKCQIEVDEHWPVRSLNSEQRHNLLMAFKEALTNIVRHARATAIRIGISIADDTLVLSVRDDGCGFARASGAPAGDGLPNITRRMERLGGRCELESAVAKGTSVRLILPLDQTRPMAEPPN